VNAPLRAPGGVLAHDVWARVKVRCQPVVAEREGYVIAEKIGEAGEIVEELGSTLRPANRVKSGQLIG
jgi:hypothetical protein